MIVHSRVADQNGWARYQSTHGLCPFCELHIRQQLTRFDRTVKPPWTFGMT